jgi:nucleoside-diphosphate-sugar epimerase
VEDFLALLQPRAPFPHTIVFSSHSVYGKQAVIPTPEDVALHPSTHYGATKVALEAVALAAYHESSWPITVVRPSLMYGPQERPGALVSMFLGKAMRGERITLDGGGNQTRDIVHVSDVVRAVLLLLDRGGEVAGQVFNVGSGQEVTIAKVAQMAVEEMRNGSIVLGPVRAGEEGRLFLDSSRIKALGYRPQVDFNDGFKEVAMWVRSRH